MPWKGEKNPYKIWLSEIILQQTRVEQGLKYYEKFTTQYPTIQHLANAPADEVLKNWEGLGYYSRCRNLHFTAKFITNELNGIFPSDFESILALKGVGIYTASAICSFAYNLPRAVVDGNVVRVLSRILASNRPFISMADKKYYQDIADLFLSKKQSALFNQAIMDFGATVCKPQNPLCNTCPLQKYCAAYKQNVVADYPVKKIKAALKKRYFHYIIINSGKHIFIKKRGPQDIWQSLYEPILFEQKTKPAFLKANKAVCEKQQKLSHQHLFIKFYEVEFSANLPISFTDFLKVTQNSLAKKAFPKSVFDFFKEYDYI